jgi:hypothetical protein
MDFTDAYGPGNYLRSIDLIDTPMINMITGMRKEMVFNPNSNEDEEKLVAHLYYGPPMIINKTNFKTLINICRSRDTEDWPGKVLTVIAIEYKSNFGDYALRIAKKPQDIKGFITESVDLKDLRARYAAVGDTKYKDLTIKLSEKWKK